MTNPPPHGTYGSSESGLNPRRTSYASVAAGTASASQSSQPPPSRPGAFSHLMNLTPSSPIPPNQVQVDALREYDQNSDMDPRAGGSNVSPGTRGREGQLPRDSSQRMYGHGTVWPGAGATVLNGFFKPTYLRGSKYMENLEAAYKNKLAAQKEASSTHGSNHGSLSRTSSSVSLHKLAPSHRGMTYEIIERAPPPDDDGIPPLPSKWGEVDKYGGLEIAADGVDVKYVGLPKIHEHEAVAARADRPIPSQCGIYYFEVSIISKGKDLG